MVSGTRTQVSPVADAEHKTAERAASRRMTVPADDEHPRFQMTAFRQHNVADALHVIEVGQILSGGEFARQIKNPGTFSIHRRHVMIRYQHYLFRIPHPDPQFFEDRLNSARAARIVDHGEIDIAGHNLAGGHGLPACGVGNNFLCERLCHMNSVIRCRG
jgi:uncharacterized membrane protein YccC